MTRRDRVIKAVVELGPRVTNIDISQRVGGHVSTVADIIFKLIQRGALVRVYVNKQRMLWALENVPEFYRQAAERAVNAYQPKSYVRPKIKPDPVPRHCLRCQEGFDANGKYQRLCKPCRELATNESSLA
jgi:hypothetical protein